MSRINVANFRHPDGTSDNINLDDSGRVLVGTSTSIPVELSDAGFQVAGSDSQKARIHLVRTGANPAYFNISAGSSGNNVSSGTILGRVNFAGYHTNGYDLAAGIDCVVDGTPGDGDMPGRLVFSTTADGASSPTERMRITSTGDLRFNSGYGSVATAYGCRAFCVFDGASPGSPDITRNVSTIGDNGVGRFTINFSNNMPDANYAMAGSAGNASGTTTSGRCVSRDGSFTTSAAPIRVVTSSNDGAADDDYISVAFIR